MQSVYISRVLVTMSATNQAAKLTGASEVTDTTLEPFSTREFLFSIKIWINIVSSRFSRIPYWTSGFENCH